LASRHFSLDMSDLGDTTDMLYAFEKHNSVKLELRLDLTTPCMPVSLRIAALAHEQGKEIGDQPPLASVNVICSDLNVTSLAAALIHVMYALDFKLALNEMHCVEVKRA